jgi:hypothetical protein
MKNIVRLLIASPLIAALLVLCSVGDTDARFPRGSSASAPSGWSQIKIGGGGQVTNLDYPTSTSAFLATTDTAGVFGLLKATSTWYEVITSASMPAAFKGDGKWLDGAYDIRSAASDPTRCYLGYNVWNGGENVAHVLKSDNCNTADPRNITFTDLTAFVGGQWSGATAQYKFIGPKIGVDPNNKDVVLVGVPAPRVTAAVTNGSATISTSPSAHFFVAGSRVVFLGSVPAGLSAGTFYYVIATGLTSTAFQVSLTSGGAAVTPSASGSPSVAVASAYLTTDGGTTFAPLPNVTQTNLTAGGVSVPPVGIAFDNSSLHNCGAGSNQTCTVWICTQGDGCWRSTTGSTGTFSKQTSGTGPTNVSRAKVGIDGTFYATEYDQSKLWRFTTTWTDISPANCNLSMAVSRATAANLAAMCASGNLAFSTNANTGTPTWSGSNSSSPTRSASDVPWLLAGPSQMNYLSTSDVLEDPVTAGKFWTASGVGVWYTTSTTTPAAFTGLSAGIEQLVVNKFASPPGGTPVMAAWDRPFYNINPVTSYKTGYGPSYAVTNNISMGWSVDWCTSAPTTLAGLDIYSENLSSYSTVSGSPNDPASWTVYANFPNLANVKIGGAIACSTPDNVVASISNNGDVYYSQNATSGAATWSVITGATFGHGVQDSGSGIETGWGFAFYANRQALCADRVTANTFYISNYQSVGLGGGTYRISFPAGVLTIQQIVSGVTGGGGGVTQLHCVPGNAGHLFYAPGQTSFGLYYTTGGSGSSATFTQITGPTNVYQVTTGAIKSGNDYPSVYINGKVGSTGGPFNDGYSIWRSDNTKAQWAANTVTWTDLGIPLNTIDQFAALTGDNNTWGVLYAGVKGNTAFVYSP